MSAPDPTNDGTFEVLDHLPGQVRQRYVEKLGKEELAAIVLAVWRKRDEFKEEATAKKVVQPESVAPVVRVDETSRNEDGHEAAARTRRMSAAKEDGARGEKRGPAQSTSQPRRKKTSADQDIMRGIPAAVEIQDHRSTTDDDNSEDEDEDEDDDYESRPIRKRASISQATEIPLPSTALEPRNLPILLYVAYPGKPQHYYSIEQLPGTVYTELLRCFDDFRSKSATKQKSYRTLSTDCARYKEREYCVADQLAKVLQVKRDGKPTPHQKFSLGGVFSFSADDSCIRQGLPCTHIVDIEGGGYALCFVPLPDAVADGVDWRELTFWVTE